MAKKLVKKRKIKFVNLLLVLLILGVFALLIYTILNSKTKNIVIIGTDHLNDDEIIEKAGIKDYPSFFLTKTSKMKKELEKDPFIEKATIKRKFYHVLELTIKENKPLFINVTNQTVVLENKKEVKLNDNDTYRVPRVMNYVPDTKYASLIEHIRKIDTNILGKISEITYVPNDYDKDRFLLYMDDDNTVYLTLTKFKMINYYNKVLTQLDGRKGILYLDSGNHFQIRE